jgi:hypothetical protein
MTWANWCCENWWYKLTQVCQRWRYLILGFTSHLGLSLLCTHGTPVADMLTHSPCLPLIIYHNDKTHDVTADDEEGIMLALQHRDRIRRIYLHLSAPSLQKLITVLDDKFPMLEYVHLAPSANHNTQLVIPLKFEAPQLRHLTLDRLSPPIGSPFLTSAVGLVSLRRIHPSTYLHLDHVMQSLSLLPQLEQLEISFLSLVPGPNSEMESQLLHTPIRTQITLPNLRRFWFRGNSSYLDMLLPRMTTPLLETLITNFFNQLSFSVPHLLQFMNATENLRFSNARFIFHDKAVAVFLYRHLGTWCPNFTIHVSCRHLDEQVSSVAQILHVLQPLFSTVIDLTLDYGTHKSPSEWHNEVNHALWCELLRSFRNAKILRVHKGLARELSRSLQLDGGPPLELLPELKELVCCARSINDKIFAPFIHDRGAAGQPIKLIREEFPTGHVTYRFHSSAGSSYITPE